MAAVKALQQWCRIRCEGYRDVAVTNMTTSFRDGMAFCALIHRHRPDLINFDSLNKENVYENNKLAFRVAEEELGIPALLDAEDMVALKVPDRLSILTYVSQYYNYFHGRSPIGGMGGIKRPPEVLAEEPSGKKNQPVASKVFPSPKATRENRPPPSSNITRPPPSPKQSRNMKQDEKPSRTGTLSNKCVSCNKHVHLVQRHLVDGKLYHRSCAKLLSPTNTTAPFRDLPTNTPASTFAPLPDANKTGPASRLGPTWRLEKHGAPKPVASLTTSGPTVTMTTTTRPVAAPRTSAAAPKTLQSKLKFFQSENAAGEEEKKAAPCVAEVKKHLSGDGQPASAGNAVTMVLNTGGFGRKEVTAETGKESERNKAKAAAFISKKLEENHDDGNPAWATVVLKKTDKSSPHEEPPKREVEAVRGRRKLKADPSLLADLQTPEDSAPSPASWTGLRARTPDREALKPGGVSANASAAENETPADWRSMLKPVSKPAAPSLPSSKPWADRGGKPQTPEPHHSGPSVCVPPPAPKGVLNGQRGQTTNDTQSEPKSSKIKPDYIHKDDIIRELQEIEDNLNELEKQGVELEMKLREQEGEDDSLMDGLMVDWFNLIRNKQVAMRRESELVYIGRTQDLEEEQPSVEQELRSMMEKPDRLKTTWERKREEQLMAKLVEIVNDRNAIVEGLDEDRIREEEEDEQLNRMMEDFNIKKDKPKKKSPMNKLFGWGNKKEG